MASVISYVVVGKKPKLEIVATILSEVATSVSLPFVTVAFSQVLAKLFELLRVRGNSKPILNPDALPVGSVSTVDLTLPNVKETSAYLVKSMRGRWTPNAPHP